MQGAHAAFGDQDAEAFGNVVDVRRAHAQADAVFAALYAKNTVLGRLEEEREVLLKDKRKAREIAQCWHDATGLKLRKKAGGKAGQLAELDQAHGALEAQAPNALAQVRCAEKLFGGRGVYRRRELL